MRGKVRQVSATAVKAAAKGKVSSVATVVHGAGVGNLEIEAAAAAVAEGTKLAMYRYEELKSKKI